MKEKRAKETVNAVHDDKFEGFLRKLGIYNDVINGGKKCKFCGEVVNYDHISTVFAESGDIKFVCEKPECIAKFSEYLADKNND
jgi:hypothetical protein